jgi:Na+/H+ antiporter NhaD/arsenite permease-like protein
MFSNLLKNRRQSTIYSICALLLMPLIPIGLLAASADPLLVNLTSTWYGYISIVVFVLAYALVIAEEAIHLKKSKPVVVAAGIIWFMVALAYIGTGDTHTAEELVRHNILEFAELFLFLLAAMTYINTMEERGVFNLLRVKLVTSGFSFRQIFWITGLIAFFMSPIADNLTTALLMATVAISVGGTNLKFISLACINIVVAANAGGAFSPFGDITTLMVWQAGIVDFTEFFILFIPSVINWGVTAVIISFAIPNEKPPAITDKAELEYGAWVVVGLFILTITMAVCFHNFLHLPPVLGMMTGLGFLKLFGYYLAQRDRAGINTSPFIEEASEIEAMHHGHGDSAEQKPYDIYQNLQRAEWDTLIFFYGIILCVGGLGAFGYLALVSQFLYIDLGATTANVMVGFASAIVDNIPVMFAVLSMNPDMSHGQWLLVTLTAGVGGSMLSIGSAAGVAVMGQARGIYTFFGHLKWAWAIALGYGASIVAHFVLNGAAFEVVTAH